VAQLFTGAVADWGRVGGKAGPVHVYARDRKSGTFDSFAGAVLRGRALKADAKSFDDSQSLAAAVAADEGAIGFVGLSLVGAAKALAIHESGAQPLYPTVFTVATEDYPLSRRLRLYTPGTPTALAQKLVDFALSDEGQRLVEQAGFVALTVRTERPALPPAAPPAYKKETQGAERLSLNFRFRTGSSSLDNKGQADVERLIAYLAQPDQRARKIKLLGFADNQGGAGVNQELSRQRAQAIAGFLAPRGVVPASIVGLGSALPVAPNDTPEGRDRNRRVEVWLR
jgi:phosphate transport system substrate-binding protein